LIFAIDQKFLLKPCLCIAFEGFVFFKCTFWIKISKNLSLKNFKIVLNQNFSLHGSDFL
jgi:hypothetical protein